MHRLGQVVALSVDAHRPALIFQDLKLVAVWSAEVLHGTAWFLQEFGE